MITAYVMLYVTNKLWLQLEMQVWLCVGIFPAGEKLTYYLLEPFSEWTV